MREEFKIEIEDNYLTGGYIKIKANRDSKFVDAVNEKLGNYWVSTGKERNMENVMFEVLAEAYDNLTPVQSTGTNPTR